MNMHKPFLCSQMCLISDYTGDYSWTEEFLPGAAKYFDCYDHYYFHENSGLYVWQDDIMIGMDNDPATFGRPPFSTANIYLNSFIFLVLPILCLFILTASLANDRTKSIVHGLLATFGYLLVGVLTNYFSEFKLNNMLRA